MLGGRWTFGKECVPDDNGLITSWLGDATVRWNMLYLLFHTDFSSAEEASRY